MIRTLYSLLALWLALAAGVSLAASPPLTAVSISRGPALTGDLSDPLWEKAAPTTAFVAADGISAPQAATDGYLLADADALYVGFICHEPKMGELVANVTERDGTVWGDDCVEFLLDPSHAGTWMYHFIVNSKGAIWDGLHSPAGTDAGYDCPQVTARTAVGADRWSCELRIPWDGVGGPPQPGEVWGVNFCRERKVTPEEVTSWAPSYGNFTDPGYLGELAIPPRPGPVTLRILSRGAASTDANEAGLNVFSVAVDNRGGKPANLRLTVRAGQATLADEQVEIAAGKSQTLEADYAVPAEGQPRIDFAVLLDGGPVYGNSLAALKPAGKTAREWLTEDPLYEELLSDEPPGLRSEGHLMWSHLVLGDQNREAAVRLGVRYVLDEAYGEYSEHKSRIISAGAPSGERAEMMARHDVKIVLEGATRAQGSPWILDPASVDNMLASVERVLQQPHPFLWAVSAGDEMDEIAQWEGADLMADPPEGFPYLKQADEEVKQQYGGGQYGIPEGRRDPNPYRWIAYRRWCCAKLRERNERLRDLVKRYDPQMPLLGMDAQGGRLWPYEWSSQADIFDIFTQQWTPAQTRWRQQLGAISKALSDLTGKDVWPCAHVENYTMATTPEEVVEELSQIFRNGGSGIHLYMPDTGNGAKLAGDTRVCYFGSPRRYHTVMNVLDLTRSMPPPEYPTYDRTAILFNDDTMGAEPAAGGAGYCAAIEACYTLLGPVARSWPRFVDCAQVMAMPSLNERFDVIYVPTAPFLRKAIVVKLREFVIAGGTLITGDRNAFKSDDLGNDTAASRVEIFGVTDGPVHTVNTFTPAVSELGEPITFSSDVPVLQAAPDGALTVLATYHNGDPALTSNALGQGRAIMFARSPFGFGNVADAQWRDFFTNFVKWTGAPTGLDIWRFQFPQSVIWREPPQPGFCLTNNHVIWREETPRYPQNREIGATYRCSPAPDAAPDEQSDTDAVPCRIGHLTDRRDSIMAEKSEAGWYAPYALPAGRWLLSWAQTDPIAITFDLRQAWKLLRLKLWFRDTMPEVTIEGSNDGQQWLALGVADPDEAGADVKELVVSLDQTTPCRYLRASFAARRPDQKLTIVEAEVWGTEE